MPKPVREITAGPVTSTPASEVEQILRFLRNQRGLAYTASEITLERSPLFQAMTDAPLDNTLKWVHGVRHEPHDVRLERIRNLLDELTAEGKLHRATGEDGQHYYWPRDP
jgi:hypothetical protein